PYSQMRSSEGAPATISSALHGKKILTTLNTPNGGKMEGRVTTHETTEDQTGPRAGTPISRSPPPLYHIGREKTEISYPVPTPDSQPTPYSRSPAPSLLQKDMWTMHVRGENEKDSRVQ